MVGNRQEEYWSRRMVQYKQHLVGRRLGRVAQDDLGHSGDGAVVFVDHPLLIQWREFSLEKVMEQFG